MNPKNVIIVATVRSGHNFIRKQIESWDKDKRFLIGNFEDVLPDQYEERKKSIPVGGKLINREYETLNVIVVRDLFNWLASYLKWIIEAGVPVNRDKYNHAVYIWTQQIKEAYNETNFIPNKIKVSYNTFKDIQNVRKTLCYFIGGSFNDDLINVVPDAGGGSSFDKQAKKGSKMNTSMRWKQILNTSYKYIYLKTLRDNKPAIWLNQKYFPPISEEQKEFFKKL